MFFLLTSLFVLTFAIQNCRFHESTFGESKSSCQINLIIKQRILQEGSSPNQAMFC